MLKFPVKRRYLVYICVALINVGIGGLATRYVVGNCSLNPHTKTRIFFRFQADDFFLM